MPLDLTELRPADSTSTAIAAALTRAETAQRTTTQETEATKRRRDELLLDGTAAQLAAADRALAAARDVGERVDAIVAQLAERLPAAKRAERLAALEQDRRDTEAIQAALATWWETHGATITAMMTEGTRLAKAASLNAAFWYGHRTRVGLDYPAEAAAIPAPDAGTAASAEWRKTIARLLDL